LGPIPNPQSPIPNPQSPIPIINIFYYKYSKKNITFTNKFLKQLKYYTKNNYNLMSSIKKNKREFRRVVSVQEEFDSDNQ
jgi:hypothetical protein